MQSPSLFLVIVFILKFILPKVNISTPTFYFHLHKIFFIAFNFQSVCVPRSEVCLLQPAYIWILFCTHSSSLWFLIGVFSPFTFKIINDMSNGKASVYNVGDLGSIPGLGRSPGQANGNPLQYYCLENPMDREAWQATVHGVAKSWIRLSDFTFFHDPLPFTLLFHGLFFFKAFSFSCVSCLQRFLQNFF